jgi:3-phytase
MKKLFILAAPALLLITCKQKEAATQSMAADSTVIIEPAFATDTVAYDSDDPAFWINPSDPSQSLIIGTDKGGDTGDGALYVFDLKGKEVPGKTIRNIKRPNNVDVAYGLVLQNKKTDIAVCTERNTNSIRVFSLPDMKPIDQGGIPVFENDSLRAPMGIALYTNPADGKIYAIVGRKTGPTNGTYLYQYLLQDNGNGTVKGKLVRSFGNYSGKNEIESIAVDNELGYIYCSDEGVGIRKYYAHPDSSSTELALFGTTGFTDNHEGISIYKFSDGTGYILVSDQQANQFHIFPREGRSGNPHDHPVIKSVKTSTIESDGSDVTSIALPGFEHGLFVAMSDNKTFQFYRWEDIAGQELKKAN